MIIAIDWANEDDRISCFNGKKVSHTMPKVTDDLVIVTENIPLKYARPYLEAGIPIWRCGTNEVAEVREERGLEKSHDVDAQIIWELYETNPEKFRELKVDPLFQQFKALYSTFKGVQDFRQQTANKIYADDDAVMESILIDIEKQEATILKSITKSLKELPIYTGFLAEIKGVGPATSAGLLAFVGDINRFPTVSHLMAYFGLDVREGRAPKRSKGKMANWHHKGRSLLCGVIADSFVKQRTPKYRDIYDAEKARQLEICDTPIHAERRARRKAVKQFVKDFYREYKRLGRGTAQPEKMAEDAPRSKARKKLAYKKAKKLEATVS